MTYLRHQCSVAFALVLLIVICVQSTGALPSQGPDANPGRNTPTCHCCHGKLFVKLDRRFNLKPVFLPPSRVIGPDGPAKRPKISFRIFLCLLHTGAGTTARWRGPPNVSPIVDSHPDECPGRC